MRRIWAAVGAVALAVLGTIVLVAYVRGAEDRALEGEELVTVLVVDEPVAKGTEADAAAIAVREELVPVKVRADDSVASLDTLSGLVASVDLVPGEQVLASRFLNPEVLAAATEVDVPPGLLQVTISLDPARAVGGQLIPGENVAVVASFEPFDYDAVEAGEEPEELFGDLDLDLVFSELGIFHVGAPLEDNPLTLEDESTARSTLLSADVATPHSTHIIGHKVLVANVQVEEQPIIEGEGSSRDLAPTGNLLITLATDAETVERIVFTAEHGSVWLASEPADAPEPVTPVRTRGNIYR